MISLEALNWRQPLWLLLAFYPIVMLLVSRFLRTFSDTDYADKHLQQWVLVHNHDKQWSSWIRHLVYLLAWCCLAVAMAGPRIADSTYYSGQSDDTEVMIVLDVSQSMAARDLLPNRLGRAYLELLDFLRYSDHISVGLSVFAARSHLVSPVTHDKSVIRHYLASVKAAMLPTAGSNISDALLFAAAQFDQERSGSRVILLISDGDAHDEKREEGLKDIASQIRQAGISVYTLGMGTTEGQAVTARLESSQQHLQSELSMLQRDYLQRLAVSMNGRYADVAENNDDWYQLYEQGIKQVHLDRQAAGGSGKYVIWRELYHLPLITGFFLFVLVYVAGNKSRISTRTSAIIPVLFLALLAGGVSPVTEASDNLHQDAYAAYTRGDYEASHELYAQLAGFEARLAEADSHYLLGNYLDAADLYMQAFLIASDDSDRSRALFNLGNAFYQLEEFQQAKMIYQDVLRYQPQHRAAVINSAHAARQQRLKESRQSGVGNAGRGPATKRTRSGLEVGGAGVTLDDTEVDDERNLPTGGRWLDETSLIQQAELASNKRDMAGINSNSDYRFDTPESLQRLQKTLDSENDTVWKRIFEEEEGFPAPVALPHPVPGVAPW